MYICLHYSKVFKVYFSLEVKHNKNMFKRRNGFFFKLLRLWLPLLVMAVTVFLVFLYMNNHNLRGSLHSQSFQQVFAKNIYQKIHTNTLEVTTSKPRNYCEVIHIGIVSAGFTSNLHLNALLKSLFLHRLNPIHFHLLVDDDSEIVLGILFKTWQLPQVKVTFYNIKKWLKDVRWVPNGHYSGNYGLLKLIYSKIIPTNITKKLLVLDTDLIINGDIFLLWKYFEEFNIKQAVGLVENQSQYYLGKLRKTNPWPAIGCGFNTGVMLYDLEKLNSMKWNTIWVNLTKRLNLIYGQTNLGDQDIVNSVIVQHPNILFRLPCYWNTQMSDNSLSEDCYKTHKPMILHWNSPKKFDVTTKDGEKFRGLANTAFEFNGNWFRKSPQMCDEGTLIPMTIKLNDADDCQTFIKPPNVLYRTLLFFREYKYVTEEYDITYVTHLSYDRFGLIEDIVKIWTGPMSFTLYVTDAELMKVYRLISESDILNPRTDISYHAVFKEGDFYPINTLRNTGLKNVNTPYVFLADIDFTPMNSLYEILKDNIKSMGDINKKALIVPAFELKKSSVKIPKSKIQLLKALDKKQVVPFLANTWTAAHIPTDYEKWRREFEPYQVQWKANYEPYILVKKDIVRYDERFLGFGWNKVSHIMELKAQDYEFIVLSDVFIIHQTHQPSYDNMKYRKSAIYRQCLQSLKTKFIEELHKKYNKTRTDLDDIDDISDYFINKRKKERKRDVTQETTTTLYDSTDFFLVWGGKEKAERKKESRKQFLKESFQTPISDENLKLEYNYYDENYPYNSTAKKSKFGKSNLKESNVNTKYLNFTSSEEHDYEYSDDDVKFRILHDSTTNVDFVENSTALIEHEKNGASKVAIDEKLKAI